MNCQVNATKRDAPFATVTITVNKEQWQHFQTFGPLDQRVIDRAVQELCIHLPACVKAKVVTLNRHS